MVGLLALAGIGFLLVAANLYFSALWGPVGGALAVGVGLLLAAGGILWIAVKMSR